MYQVPINYLAVFSGAVASMVLGFLWYGPIFGKIWLGLSGLTMEKIQQTKSSSMTTGYVLNFIGALVTAFILAHFLVFATVSIGVQGTSAGLQVAFWSWLGFIAPVTLGAVLWEQKSWKLWFLNNSYQLVNLCVVGVILALWK